MKTRLFPLIALLPLALVIVATMPGDFILGQGIYWSSVISDRAQSLAGYLYFAAAPWSPDMLFIPNLSLPEGERLINADSIVLVSLLGKLLRSLTGVLTNPYGYWYVFCWLMNGVAAIVILRSQGVTDLPRLACAALLIGLAPFWLERWYHFSLIAHFLLLLSFHAYLLAGRGQPKFGLTYLLVLCLLAALVHIYLWCMLMMVLGATTLRVSFAQARFNPASFALACTFGLLSIGFVVLAGYLSLSGSSENTGYMSYSTNLLSPFYSNHSAFSPQSWALLAQARDAGNAWLFFAGQRPEATGAQFLEGMSYLGAGIWFLVLFVLVLSRGRGILPLIRRHKALLAVCIVALLYAVTPYVTIGSTPYPLWRPSDAMLSMLGALRASGRFFWIPGYLVMIAAVVMTCRVVGRTASTVALMMAAMLQFADTTPIRLAVALDASLDGGVPGGAFWDEKLRAASALIILPSYECGTLDSGNVKSYIQVKAAQLGPIPTNSASQSRTTKDCAAESSLLNPDQLKDRAVYVFLDADGHQPKADAFIAARPGDCSRFPQGTACVMIAARGDTP